MTLIMVKSEPLGTIDCPDCAIMKEKMHQLNLWEENLAKREAELDAELEHIRKNKIY